MTNVQKYLYMFVVMKREIKFRGLRTDGKGWVYGYYFFDKDVLQAFIITDTKNIDVFSDSVGQFTGLKDKNGVDIYEGDILTETGDREITVNWFIRLASFCLDSKGWAWSHFFDEALHPSNVSIIGNIHEPKH